MKKKKKNKGGRNEKPENAHGCGREEEEEPKSRTESGLLKKRQAEKKSVALADSGNAVGPEKGKGGFFNSSNP